MIADIGQADFGWVHALNKTHEKELSPLTPDGLEALVGASVYARQADGGSFLIGFDQSSDYDSPNFIWFQKRFEKFLYVDRIAVAASHRRRGLAAALYEDFFAFAWAEGYPRIACEVNSDPPNPGSDAFHAALGFEIIGEARLPDRGKSVRYMTRELA